MCRKGNVSYLHIGQPEPERHCELQGKGEEKYSRRRNGGAQQSGGKERAEEKSALETGISRWGIGALGSAQCGQSVVGAGDISDLGRGQLLGRCRLDQGAGGEI